MILRIVTQIMSGVYGQEIPKTHQKIEGGNQKNSERNRHDAILEKTIDIPTFEEDDEMFQPEIKVSSIQAGNHGTSQ